MGLFFGTDGLRGEFGKGITPEISFRVGNSLAKLTKEKGKILIATDTRKSGDVLALSFCSGAMCEGIDVVFVGVCPTAGVSYLAKELGFDYGVVISASHNSAEFNGIKIFDKNGKKLSVETEKEIERNLLKIVVKEHFCVGSFSYDEKLTQKYIEFLKKSAQSEIEKGKDFSSLKIVLDTANGAASKIAGKIFAELGASVIQVGLNPNGTNINRGVGVMFISNLLKQVLKTYADFGFAYDGDSDRLLAVASDGKVIDGDELVYIFAKQYLKQGKLKNKKVVGTVLTNLGIEKALNEFGVELIRTDVGDKFVSEAIEKDDLLIGGESSGHVFVFDKLQTGDGILNSLLLTCFCVNQNKKLGELAGVKKCHQKNINVKVKNKNSIIKNQELQNQIKAKNEELKNHGRLIVRASGTEEVIRIMAECEDELKADYVANELEKTINKIDFRGGLCVE